MPREFKKRLMRKVRALFSCHSKTPLKTLPCHNSTSVNEPPKIVMERRSSGSPSNQPVKQKPRGIRMSRRAVQRSKYLREKFGVRKTVMGFSPREGSISEEDENDMTLWRLAENAEDVIIDGLAWLKNDDGNDDGDEDDNYVDDDDDEEKILQRWIESNSFDSLNNYDDNYRDDDDVSLLSDDDDDIHDDDDDVNHYGRNNHNKDCNHDEDYNDDDDNKSDADDNDDNNGENNGDNNSDNNGDNNSDNNGDNNDDDYNDDSDVDDDYVFISNDDLKSNPNTKAISDEKNESIDDDDDDDDKNESFDDGDYDDDDDDKNESIDDDDYDDDDKNEQLVQEPKAENHYRNASHKSSYLSNHMKDSQNIDTVYSSTINECVDINPNNCLQQSDYPDRSVSKGRVDKDMNKNFSLNGIKMSKMSPKDASKSSTKIEEKISWKNSSDASVDKHMLAVSANCKVNQRPLNLDAENDDTVNNNDSGLKGDVSQTSQSDVINTTRHGNTLPNDVISQTAKTLESHSGIAALVENANSKKSVTERESDASSGSSETLVIEEKEKRVSEELEEFGNEDGSDQNGFENVFDSMKKDMEAVWCRMENIENDFILARTTLNEMRTTKKN